MSDEDKKDYDIGYRKPPVETRFRKGQSGNPNGRPVGTFSIKSALEKALNETVSVMERGKKRILLKGDVVAQQLVNKAASGELRAIRLLLDTCPQFGVGQQTIDQQADPLRIVLPANGREGPGTNLYCFDLTDPSIDPLEQTPVYRVPDKKKEDSEGGE